MPFPPRPLGATGISTSAVVLASSYGVGARGVRRAFDGGVRAFYWGSLRRSSFGRGVRDLARGHRDEMVVAVQTYARLGWMVGPSLSSALWRLGLERADVLLLGWWNRVVPERILEAARAEVERGRARAVLVSCHRRATFRELARDPRYDALMVRYNAAHPGAERDTFPHLGRGGRGGAPGVIAYTATSWGRLVDPRRTPAGERTPRAADCYRFCLSHPAVDACLAGPKDERELEDALEALAGGPLEPDERAWLLRVGGGGGLSRRAGRAGRARRPGVQGRAAARGRAVRPGTALGGPPAAPYDPAMEPPKIADEEELERALSAPAFLLFKHSLVCPTSAQAFSEYRHFLASAPNTPTAWIDVRGQRPLSQAVEARTGVRHESPQAFWIRDGRVAWHASHGAITRDALRVAADQAADVDQADGAS